MADLARTVRRGSWQVYAFVILSNHLHIVVKTPQPDLGRGMQRFLSSYANAWARRRRFSGHVFQGRYRTELVEDESYLWTVSRYVHLNPVRAGLVEHPSAWRWSSYPGYADRRRRLEWVAHDELLKCWAAGFGGSDPAAAYRQFVTAGLAEPPPSPWSAAHHGWVLGSAEFAARLGQMVRDEPPRALHREARLARSVPLAAILEVVCRTYGVESSELSRRGSRHEARAALAYLARRHTVATNASLAEVLGVSRPDSVPNLTRRFARWLSERGDVRQRHMLLEQQLRVDLSSEKTGNPV